MTTQNLIRDNNNQGDQIHGDEEVIRLRQHVAELEQELFDQAARTNDIVAAAQDRVYWLDRWNIDLNRLMATPLGRCFRLVIRPVGSVRRIVRKLRP